MRLLCVAAVTAVMLPVGGMLFPYVESGMSGMQFHTLEAVLSTTLGFGIFSILG
ncbi:MAG TPA: hypothetical protein VHV56_04565 [Pseudolabrys sp.]|nr:hypothetical protein [Pseudolabrys sp.]